MESTANILSTKLPYSTKYKAKINVKGLALPQRVYTVEEPTKATIHHSQLRRTSLTVGSPTMNSFDSVVLKILKSPSTRQKVKEAVENPTD